ncbi:MAG TPA: NAD(P)(+) transhydrogenase (Re/Si-specific) subunit beta [Verrucomicrobiae bacterium]|jgi:NAD(P) transhydrogenase subunit beta|nr:NAD(P)(+) transhydrogenase (Re/Si-specific) subunit beta [Verrucomicrobiae bacterium]
MSRDTVPEAAFLVASLLFIFGLKRLSSPRTARSGNLLAAVGMALALGGTFLLPGMGHFALILLAIVIGTVPGWLLAKRVKMTAMPQMVSLFNGMGGACALFISLGEWLGGASAGRDFGRAFPMLLGVVFGSVSFTGSLVAFGKLQGLISEKPLRWPGQKIGNALLFAVILASSVAAASSQNEIWILLPAAGALLLGVAQVLPIGGADMPVVISVLNSCTGLAAAVTGFAMHNMSMIIAGTLVGAAGSLLTVLMCQAMNRSLVKVIFGSFGLAPGGAAAGAATGDQTMREIAAAECAIMMAYARKVIIVPGYGLAVAQGQHLVNELDEALEKRGVEVKYAVHPVAGRMPGHMNVLLAEANVPYPKLLDMEEINPEFDQADVALIIGANDVVNPAARTDPASPIYGMPILDADKAKNIIVIKRGRGAGFAGIENALFYNPKTRMLFGDAKKALQELVTEVKAL